MDYDYSKIINFFYGKNINKLNDVLKVVLLDGFVMLDVNVNAKMILLEKNNIKYVLTKRDSGLLIFPDNYRSVCLSDDFGELIEINTNDEGNVIVSRIFSLDNPRGIVSSTSTWHYEDNLYTEVVGRVMFIEHEKIEILQNQESLEMFLSKYYPLRNDVLNDLYWDLDLLRKNNFLEYKIFERIMVSDGYTKDTFDNFYKKHIDKVLDVVKEKGKPSLF